MDAATLPPIEDVEPIAEPPVSNGLSVVSIAKSYDKRVGADRRVGVGRRAARWSGCSARTARARRPASIR